MYTKLLRIAIFAAIVFLVAYNNITETEPASGWINAPWVFWSLWGAEAVFMSWWLLDDLKLRFIPMNPAITGGWLWLAAAFTLYLLNFKYLALILVGIAAVPLIFMGIYVAIILIASLFGPIRWN
jgi:hypothetical protein